MSMFTSTQIILAVMIAAYIIAKALKVSTDLSMFIAAIAGALAGVAAFNRYLCGLAPGGGVSFKKMDNLRQR